MGNHTDLGMRALAREWASLLTLKGLREDVFAGLTVACIAVPLSLAIALASGVEPALGLVTAIVAGIVCALFGGTPLSVSGPAAAMAVIVGSVVETHGLAGLVIATLGCGLLQVLTGVLGAGKLVRLVPVPVVEGFTAGIGAIILIGQLPRALGLPAPPESHVVDVITHIHDLFRQINPAALAVTLVSLVVIVGLPKVSTKIPSPLIGVAVATTLALVMGLDVANIGPIPRALPAPSLPSWPGLSAMAPLAGATLLVYAVASLETLLSASAVDKLVKSRSDPNQELIGQGIGNIAVAVFRGIPVTAVIARSAANIQSGARTRRASIIHALALIAIVLVAAPLMSRIPIAALAGLLIAVALRMMNVAKLIALWRVSRADAFVYMTTFIVMVTVDLLKGVQWGVIAALAIAAFQLGRNRMVVRGHDDDGPYHLALHGSLTFLSSLKMEALREEAQLLEPGRGVVLDLSHVGSADTTGAEMLSELVQTLRERGLRPAVTGMRERVHKVVVAADHDNVLAGAVARTEQDTTEILEGPMPIRAGLRLKSGVARFRREQLPRYAELFKKLARAQAPHTLFIACSDSRMNPNLMTSTDPGELFVVRNVGNMVPAEGAGGAAEIEYAVAILGVREIVVCGHSSCGAIQTLLSPDRPPASLRSLNAWLARTDVRELCTRLPSDMSPDDVSRLNALAQLDHLRSYPVVREHLARGELELHAWFFDIGSGEIEAWSPEAKKFVPFGVAADGEGKTSPGAPSSTNVPKTEEGPIGREPARVR